MKIKNKFKKISISLVAGTIAMSPAIASISCGKVKIEKFKILPTYTSHADMLMSLGITPDYYPVQLNTGNKIYDYITNPKKHMSNEQSEEFKNQIANELSKQYNQIKKIGRSWWNQNAEKADNTNPSPEYWTKKYGEIVFYEHYLLDDDKKAIDSNEAPGYKYAVEANFRAAQDPYTRVPKKSIEDFANKNTTNALSIEFQKAFGLRKKDGSIIENMWSNDVPIIKHSAWNTENEYFDDAYFAYTWNFKYLNNSNFINSQFASFVKNSNGGTSENVFYEHDNNIDYILAELFNAATLDGELSNLEKINYLKIKDEQNTNLYHHPIYDAQTEVGEAPMFEGSRRDPMIYFYQLASSLSQLINGQDEMGNNLQNAGLKEYYENIFEGDYRYTKMQNALENANLIASNFKTRLENIKILVESMGILGKTFGIVTVEPGDGVATIQTNSKYDFLLDKIGLKYPIPSNFSTEYISGSIEEKHVTKDSMYTMDDNSWFWNLGSQTQSSGASNDYKFIDNFAQSADFGVITTRDISWSNMKENNKNKFINIFKGNKIYNIVDYDIWNEGLKAPFALNMVVDQMVDSIIKYANDINVTPDIAKKSNAYQWGNYWTNIFGK